MAKKKCEYQGCSWTEDSTDLAVYLGLLKIHVDAVHPQSSHAPSKPEKAKRPELAYEVSDEDWDYFLSRWSEYKKVTNLSKDELISQLMECCCEQLRRDHHRMFLSTGIQSSSVTEDTRLAELKQIAVRKRNKAVNRVKLVALKQDKGEPVRKFAGRIRSLASVSGYSVKCKGCQTDVSYTDAVIMDQIITGLADPEVQKDVLSLPDQDQLTLEKLLIFIEGKESGLTSQGLMFGDSAQISAQMSAAKKVNKCRWCGDSHIRGKANCKAPGNKCQKCGKIGHFDKVCRSVKVEPQQQQLDDVNMSENCNIFINSNKKDFWYPGVNNLNKSETHNRGESQNPNNGQMVVYSKLPIAVRRARNKKKSQIQQNLLVQSILTVMVASSICTTAWRENKFLHHVYMKSKGWVKQSPKEKPFVNLSVQFDKQSANHLAMVVPNRLIRKVSVYAMADTGASVCMAGRSIIRDMCLNDNDLTPCAMELTSADKSSIKIVGAIPVVISDAGTGLTTRQILYISNNASSFLLSLEACSDLNLVETDFPVSKNKCISMEGQEATNGSEVHGTPESSMSGSRQSLTRSKCDCKCPDRVKPPETPSSMPFEPTPENIPALENWIREFYASSAFNCCECQPLPKMHGPPLKIFIKDGVKPVAAHTPIPIPLHWQKQVKAGLDRDEAIGVIEKVPSGTPTTWCHRMVVVPKKDNSPRRTVNFMPLNQYSVRQTHHTMSPFHQASMVPANTRKTVLDAWNGYHSVFLDPSCRDLTTFITPWGRYRYKTTPQGYLAAGDAYTERFDKIIADVPNKTKCVDDTIMWANSIQESFFQTCKFLTLCAENGIIFNQKKFQFCREEVEFAGFIIGKSDVRPAPKILDSIKSFPVPKNISDVRGWFGLVNQVAPFFANRAVMEPFRELLKPAAQGKHIYWDDNLTKLFEESKEIIIEKIKEGIKCFDMEKWTCLMPDFCKTGIGFLLTQKQCLCSKIDPYCCSGGWKVVLAGSRFTKGAESRYAPVEGEALAVVWSLEAARHYTLGNPKLVIATDHKPLLKVLGDRKLEDIDNPRLAKLKEKTLRWKYDIIHVPGKIHVGPDTLSRKEVSMALISVARDLDDNLDCTEMELSIENQIAVNMPSPISWQEVREAVSKDKLMHMLSDQISNGFPPDKKLLRLELREYYQHRDHLSQVDGVPLYKGRVIIPECLRKFVLETLHSAHQGITGMTLRAQTCVWWPGITPQIKEMREKCHNCNEHTPSQPSAPPQPLIQPEYPFQQVVSDYFQAGGHHYLVIADRFSGWPAIQFCGASDGSSIKLNEWLRQFFATYGIPEELSSDGGKTYTSYETQKFLSNYGIKHRLSSVAYPHSNQRAELTVKSMKRLIRENTGADGNLNNDKFLRALMQYRNTPDRDIGLSPAQIIFGRSLRDFLPSPQSRYKVHRQWVLQREDRERALAKRAVQNMERLAIGTKNLPPLEIGDNVLVQNQVGNHPSRWDITGIVVEKKSFDQYIIKIDGSGRMTLRNRKFLRKISPLMGSKHLRQQVGIPYERETEVEHQAQDPPISVEDDNLPNLILEPDCDVHDRPPNTSVDEDNSPIVRRSTRERREPDRLVVKSFKGQTYDDTANKSVALSLTSCWPRGGGGINDV